MIRKIGSVLKPGTFLDFDAERQQLVLSDIESFRSQLSWHFEGFASFDLFFYRINNAVHTDHYIHVQTEALSFEPIHFGANSAFWFLDPLENHDTFVIRNLWRPDYFIYLDGDRVTAGFVADVQFAPQAHWRIEEPSLESLLVPIHLDALWLPHPEAVVDAMTDFTRLPHFNGRRDINPDTANLSESIINPALISPQLYLDAGIHLHWAMPDALHSGDHIGDRMHFPIVPDRWLVTRYGDGNDKRWIIESNYLYPPNSDEGKRSIPYPFSVPDSPHPYRHMGRKLPFEGWTERDRDGQNPDYFHQLTALGYGEPSFASFYPNCHSVFGFYDEESQGKSLEELKNQTYEIIGWHSANDLLGDPIFGFKIDNLLKANSHADRLSIAPYKFETLKQAFGWHVESADDRPFPNATFYFARLTITPEASGTKPQPAKRPKIVLANTPTEALSKHLGHEIGGTEREKVIEEQLEALMLLPEVEGMQIDTTARFREARHKQGFRGLHGGSLTTIRPVTDSSLPADAQINPHQLEVALPLDIYHKLDQLNELETAVAQGLAKQQAKREQLFSDWYKYMLSAYPPEVSPDELPNMDEIAFFIEQCTLKELEEQTQTLKQGESSLISQRQQARRALAEAVDSLQMLFVHDISDWPRLLALLAGQVSPEDSAFQPILARLGNALPDRARSLLDERNQGRSLSVEEKETILAAINHLIDTMPSLLVSPETQTLLPSEAQQKLSQDGSIENWNRLAKQRFGRLVLETALPMTLARRPRYTLEKIPAPRYWQPNDPVVLIADADLHLTERHGEDGRLRDDGLLPCYLTEHAGRSTSETAQSYFEEVLHEVVMRIDDAEAGLAGDAGTGGQQIGFYRWVEHPWHPFMLEWSVEFFPMQAKQPDVSLTHQFEPDFITDFFVIPEDGVEFQSKQAGEQLVRSGSVYSGRTVMLDYAQPLLIDRLEAYCAKYLAPQYYQAENIPAIERKNKPPLADITAWAIENRDQLSPFDQAVLDIQNHLAQNETPPIAQALAGFNAALLQHVQTLQLPIEDPLGFPRGKRLAGAVKNGVGDANLRAPKPLDTFNPIRAGALRLLNLRLVDTFGQFQTLFDGTPSQVVQSSQPFEQLDPQTILLPPRLTQPLRLNAWWLSAASGQSEDNEMPVNADPATSPICGWLMPNYYDNSLLVYAHDGQPLGSLIGREGDIVWSSAPGRQHRLLEADILNDHLFRLVSTLLSQNSEFLDDMLTGLARGLENVLPHTGAENGSLALLVGRPLALVRAGIGFELMGQPATNQSWNRFRRSLATHRRFDERFPDVAFELRIGEHARLNDGLLGFWIEKQEQDGSLLTLAPKLYLPQSSDAEETGGIHHPNIIMHQGDVTPHIRMALNAPDQTLTMLVDPRAAVNISSGILPVKTISIHPDLYLPALQNLEMIFFSGPFITKQDGVELPIPAEPGFTWSLHSKENGAWHDTQDIEPVEQNATLSGRHMIREGWLKLKKEKSNVRK